MQNLGHKLLRNLNQRSDSRFFVSMLCYLILEGMVPIADRIPGVGCEVWHVNYCIWVGWTDCRNSSNFNRVFDAFFLAKSRLETTRAAPPSLVEQISKRRSGSATTGDAFTSSTVNTFAYRAFGLLDPCSDFSL